VQVATCTFVSIHVPTHQGVEDAEASRLVTFIVVQLLNGAELRTILSDLSGFETPHPSVKAVSLSDPSSEWNWRVDDFRYCERATLDPGFAGRYAVDALAMTTTSAGETLIKANSMRGDADSVGSATGQIIGAAYGASADPREWMDAVRHWDHHNIALCALRLFERMPASGFH
jgi:ADP-ribosylglycohydrolase